jgi:anti-anti-sigma factor
MEGGSPEQVVEVTARRDGAGAVIEVAGELDLQGADRFSAVATEVLTEPVERIEVDARRLTFIDSAGIRAILLARADAQRRDTAFTLSGASPAVRRIIEIAGAQIILAAEQSPRPDAPPG